MSRHVCLTVALIAAGTAGAQEAAIDRLKVSFRDPTRPGSVRISLIRGGITVKGGNGQEVLIEAAARGEKEDTKAPAEAAGMRRIFNASTGLLVEEENNVMRVSVHSHRRPVDLTLQVPVKTSLKLHAINQGTIVVENVEGEIEVNNINGGISLNGVSGSAVAHALNGNLTAVFRKVDGGKPMSFSSLNGRIDVTLPPDIKADLNMKSDRGEIYSDFDVVLGARAPKLEENKGGAGGKYRVSTDAGVTGKVNGGGQEITFKNMSGNIYIRKGK
jgi:DUF4097 and DUF4098 domain-containing protein YvlB